MDGLTDIMFDGIADESLDIGGNERAEYVFRAVAKADPASVSELAAGTGLQDSALHDALRFLSEKGFIESYFGLTASGRALAARVFPDHSAAQDVPPAEAVARARAAVRLKSTFGRDDDVQGRLPGPVARDWTMPPDRNDLRRFAWNAYSEASCEGLSDGAAAALDHLRDSGPSRLAEIAAATGRHIKAVAEDMADLAAQRLAVDVSDGAEERARSWEAFCLQLLGVLADGRAYPVSAARDLLPRSEFSEVKAALRYLAARGEAAMSRRGGQKVYSVPSADGAALRPGVRGATGSQRGPNWTRIEELVAAGPVTQPALASELGVSSERVRQITEVLVAEGRIRLVGLKGKGRLRCFVPAGLDDGEIDGVLAAAGLERAPAPLPAGEDAGEEDEPAGGYHMDEAA